MNLATEPWIPVTDSTGRPARVSLREVFADAGVRDLAVRPHERVALMRLLICIAQAALDGPADRDGLEDAASRLSAAASCYFERWEDCFDLFHPNKPFLQFPGLEKEDSTPASKLDFTLATGENAATLFDHLATRNEPRAFDASVLALMLVTFQCFSPSGTIGLAHWRGEKTPGRRTSGHSLCAPSAMLHAFVRREYLLQSICENISDKGSVKEIYGRPWGCPVWEQMPQTFRDIDAIHNATTTYLGRLMPLSRTILLRPDGRDLLLANGLTYPVPPSFSPEPSATEVTTADGSSRKLVSARHKAIWRELPSLMIERRLGEPGGPLALGNLDHEKPFDLWVGALVTTPNNKIEDTMEGVYHISERLFDSGGRVIYQNEVRRSERTAARLASACKLYRQHLVNLDPRFLSYPEEVSAVRRYWTSVENECLALLHSFLRAPDDGSDCTMALRRHWRSALRYAAHDAFRMACARQSPRQLRAYVSAWDCLCGNRRSSSSSF